MAVVLREFSEHVTGPDGTRYSAQACGAPNTEGLWEGWIEFIPIAAGRPVRSPRETTQPNGTDAEYWATGLTAVYLEGALARALNVRTPRVAAPARSYFDGPAEAGEPGPDPGSDGSST